jgi:hypothetical protein
MDNNTKESLNEALGFHPDSETNFAEEISRIRSESRANFHLYTYSLAKRDELECENARLRDAALAVIMPLIDDTCVHPCDEANIDVKAKACPYGVYDLYRLCLPNV